MTHDRVTTLGSGVNGSVLRISTTYDIRGLREKVTSYDNATVGSGTALNELVYEYNDLGMPTKEYQEHEGAQGRQYPVCPIQLRYQCLQRRLHQRHASHVGALSQRPPGAPDLRQ